MTGLFSQPCDIYDTDNVSSNASFVNHGHAIRSCSRSRRQNCHRPYTSEICQYCDHSSPPFCPECSCCGCNALVQSKNVSYEVVRDGRCEHICAPNSCCKNTTQETTAPSKNTAWNPEALTGNSHILDKKSKRARDEAENVIEPESASTGTQYSELQSLRIISDNMARSTGLQQDALSIGSKEGDTDVSVRDSPPKRDRHYRKPKPCVSIIKEFIQSKSQRFCSKKKQSKTQTSSAS